VFCPNCGTQNTETAPTCAKCGFQLKTAAAPKFKGTMLMMNQPGAIPGAPPGVGSQAAAAPAAPTPPSGPGFTAEAPPIGGGVPLPRVAAPAPANRLKGTMVGVAPPSFGAAPGAGARAEAPAPAAAPAASPHQSFGSAADANPLAGTMALNGPPNFADVVGAPPAGSFGAAPSDAAGFGQPPYGGPPPDAGGFNAPAYGAPSPADPAGGFGAPPSDPYGAPPGGPPYGGGGFGPPPGGDPYGAPPGAGGYGAPPMGQPMPGGPPPQDYGAQMNQGFQQVGQAFGQAADQFGQAMNPQHGGMQPYQGGAPMQQHGMPGTMMAGDPPKQFMITLLLAIFAGGFGAHRFYTGHMVYGIIQLLTLGGCGVWTIIDIIMIATGKYTDAQGRPLVK
jgi:hypothetical protein